ncbi:polymerase delta-interacting protein 3 isoform X1 [Protopterus annectens]|uniref:polymerase delta-interacting protein 3 isoform X1 n=1 Tax=Protopterus annectens TaxID=7888 RepID=UPI001CFAD15E|nr:polymerase delta-interacting protein 3 isoform X1 [Protopterus annectens]
MADLSLDDLIRKRGLSVRGRQNPRPVLGSSGIKSRIGNLQVSTSRITQNSSTGLQRTFDARQKIGVTDVRLRLGVKDAREKLVQKDARFKIQGKVQDAREMLNSRKQQQVDAVADKKVTPLTDAREKLSLKRSTPVVTSSSQVGAVSPTVKITKTIQQKAAVSGPSHPSTVRINVFSNQATDQGEEEEDEEEEEEEETITIPNKQMKITTTNDLVQTRSLASSFKLSLAKAPPLKKVVQNDTYTAPAPALVPATTARLKTLTNLSRTLMSKQEDASQQPAPAEPVLSPLEGTKMTINNLHPRVTEEDIIELFCVCGALKRARLVKPGVAEVVFVRKEDAISAYKKYNNRCLDGQPMKCNLHVNGTIITSDQPILLRLSDTPATKKEEPRRPSSRSSSNPPAEVDPSTILKALFKSSGPVSTSANPTAFKIKL